MITKRVKTLWTGPKTGCHSRLHLEVRKTTAVSFTCVSEAREERERWGGRGKPEQPGKREERFFFVGFNP